MFHAPAHKIRAPLPAAARVRTLGWPGPKGPAGYRAPRWGHRGQPYRAARAPHSVATLKPLARIFRIGATMQCSARPTTLSGAPPQSGENPLSEGGEGGRRDGIAWEAKGRVPGHRLRASPYRKGQEYRPLPRLDGSGTDRSNTRPTSGGQVAQLVEQRTENPRVGGSIPPLATTKSKIWGHKRQRRRGIKPLLWNIRGWLRSCSLNRRAAAHQLRTRLCSRNPADEWAPVSRRIQGNQTQ